ncbi:degenerin mec-4-like [Mercenaria mercenaria]|uniref:degenerin mec-4-like n=1 Tax=Mercenaria mercenaria TaxID=6596 RepID=UPI00234E611E|nr:degenerin mec-4-like [Mercenaria mercenaria]
MVRISRLGEPHGDCIDGKVFAERYKKKYSIAACYEFCRILKAIQDCDCIPAESPDEIHLNSTALPVCNTSAEGVEKCLLQVDVQFDSGEYSCDCKGPCKYSLSTKVCNKGPSFG